MKKKRALTAVSRITVLHMIDFQQQQQMVGHPDTPCSRVTSKLRRKFPEVIFTAGGTDGGTEGGRDVAFPPLYVLKLLV